MADTLTINSIIFALIGGIAPALVWLWFWLHEDAKHPEPRYALLISFIAGMGTVIAVLPFQKAALALVGGSLTSLFIAWAVIEELFKFGVAYFVAIRRHFCNEPIDPVIYLVTTALGFAALENSLFILQPLIESGLVESIATGNLRFMGATLLHTLSSATIGVFMAFSFYKDPEAKRLYLFWGIILSIALHAAFNLFIINSDSNAFLTFAFVWIALTLLILLFERIKKIIPFKRS